MEYFETKGVNYFVNILQGLCDIPDQTSKISQKQYKRNDIIIFRKQNQIQNFELLSKITHRWWHYLKGYSFAVTRLVAFLLDYLMAPFREERIWIPRWCG